METQARIQLRFLGPVQVRRDGKPLRGFESRKALALLAYLAVVRLPMPRERLVDLFWPDKMEAKGRANLSWVLSKISGLLPDCLAADRHTVQFQVGPQQPCWVDLYAFEALRAQGDPGSLAAAVDLSRGEFLEGLSLKKCPEFEGWQVQEQERWRRRVAGVLDELVEYHSRCADYEGALRFGRRLLALEPWREEVYRALMRLLAWDGQRGAALAQYEACRNVLENEFGAEPSFKTNALYDRLRSGKLEPPAPPLYPERGAGFTPDLSEKHEVTTPGSMIPAEEPAFLDVTAVGTERRPAVFVGRQSALDRLEMFLQGALAGLGQMAFVTGGAGRGKTALMAEFARRAQESYPDLLVASGNCSVYSGAGEPYLPFRDVLSMLTGEVESLWAAGVITREQACRLWHVLPLAVRALLDSGPALVGSFVSGTRLVSRAAVALAGDAEMLRELRARTARSESQTQSLEQRFVFEQYSSVLCAIAASHPLLLLLDDLQWAEAASVGLLFHLARRLVRSANRVLIVGAYRPDEVALGRPSPPPALRSDATDFVSSHDGIGKRERHPLDKMLCELKRHLGDVWIDLVRADELEGRGFVDAFVDTEPNQLGEDFRSAMFQRTGGHPLFTVELLRAMQERGDLVHRDGQWAPGAALDWETLPARVEGVIEERFGRLDANLRAILCVASVEGETFTAEVVARVLDMDDWDLLRDLSHDLAQRHRLVRERGEVFVPGSNRTLARYQFAHALFQGFLYGSLSRGERRQVHGRIADVLGGLYEGHEEQIAVALAHHFAEAGQVEKAPTYLQLAGQQALRAHAPAEAETHFQAAHKLLEPEDGRRGEVLLDLGKAALLAADEDRAAAAYETAQAWFEEAGDVVNTARAARGRGLVYWRSDAPLRARNSLMRSLALLEGAQHTGPETVRTLVDLAQLLGVVLGRQDAALVHGRRALELARDQGESRLEAAAMRTVGFLLVRENDLPAGLQLLEPALELAEDLEDLAEAAEVAACLAQAYVWSAKIESSRQVSLRREAFARRCQEPFQSCYVYSWLGFLHASQGDWKAAAKCLAQSETAAAGVASTEPEAFQGQIEGFLAFQRGRYELAERELEKAVATFRDNHPGELMLCLGLLGLALLARGKREQARACIVEQETLVATLAAGRLPTLSAKGCLALQAVMLGDTPSAAGHYVDLLDCRGQYHWFLVDRILGHVAMQCRDWAAAESHLADAEAIAKREGLLPELGRVLVAQADLALTLDGPAGATRARALLQRARTLSEELGLETKASDIQERMDGLSG